jgi:outer membrane protein assembly factor BamD
MLRGSLRLVALLFLTSVAPSALVGCTPVAPKAALSYTADAKRAYEEALAEFNAHNWIESQNLMRDVKRRYSYSKYARLAELRIADADFEQDKFADAIRAYRQFVHDHRSDSEEVTYARSRIAEAQYKEIGDSFLLPSGDERDQAVVMEAYKELRGFVHDYPEGKETKRVRELLADVTARLVRHELYVARFYLRKDNYLAAVSRIQYALRNFSGGASGPKGGTAIDSGLEPEALLLLGETYLKMHKWVDARESFATILDRYTDSALTIQAKDYLEYMRLRGV